MFLTERESQQWDSTILQRVLREAFENYEQNRELILRNGGIDKLPLLETAIVVGAGWSLAKNVEQLADTSAPIIVSDKVFKTVSCHKKPLMVCALNTTSTDVDKWLDVPDVMMKDVWLVAPVTAHPKTFANWKGKKAFVNGEGLPEEFTTLVTKETGLPVSMRGENVGLFCLVTALSRGAKNVALLGMNYCFEREEDAWKSSGCSHSVKIMDYTGNIVYTLYDWLMSRKNIVELCESVPTAKVINCSEGGIISSPGSLETLSFNIWRRYHDIP